MLSEDTGAMAMKEYSIFPKAPASPQNLNIRLFSVINRTLISGGEVLPLCRVVVSVFYSLSQQG